VQDRYVRLFIPQAEKNASWGGNTPIIIGEI
jgi:hypothetical protein